MLYKEATRSRQSPLQKAVAWGEGAARFVGTVKGIYDTGKSIYDAGRTVFSAMEAAAPYASAAMSML